MKCILPGGNVKVLAKALHMLVKIGDEMYMHPQRESISFRTVNLAKSAYSDFTFHKNFFSYYSLGDLEEEEAQKCKISTRSAMMVFKSAYISDKQVETCHICLDVDACNLVFILKYKHGVNKSYLLPILDSEKLQASYTKTGMINELMSRARIFVDALHNFQQSLIEITLEITPQKLLLRNYMDEESGIVNTTRTQLALSVGEFERYIAGNQTTVTFCLKEFRALLTFCESIGVSVGVHFETAGKPVLFVLKNLSFEANLLLSTLNPDTDSQSNMSVVSRNQVRSSRKRSSKSTIKRDGKSSTRRKKSAISVNSVDNNTLKNRKEETQTNGTPIRTSCASRNIVFGETNNLVSDVGREDQDELKRNGLFATACATSSTTHGIAENRRKVLKSVFASITKRKSINDEDSKDEALELVDLESVSHSPPCRVAKKAKLIFQRCLQKTFDQQMLPGHEAIIVDDSNDEKSD